MSIEVGHTYRFTSSSKLDAKLSRLSGASCTIVRPLSEDECDVDEVGLMFEVAFAGGERCHVFEDELTY